MPYNVDESFSAHTMNAVLVSRTYPRCRSIIQRHGESLEQTSLGCQVREEERRVKAGRETWGEMKAI